MSRLPLPLSLDPQDYLSLHDLLDEPSADAALSDRDLEVRRLTREVAAKDVAPHAAELDEHHRFAGPGLEALARAGLCCLVFPEHLGGTGDSNVSYAWRWRKSRRRAPRRASSS